MRPDLSRLKKRLRLPFWHREDIEAEIASHVQEVENEIHAQGTDDEEARRSALKRLGDLESLGDSLQAIHHGWTGGATVQRRFARVLVIAGLIVFAGIGLVATVGKVTDVARSRRAASVPSPTPVTGQEWLSGIEFKPVEPWAPLTQEELRAAFSELGMTIERFTYEVPYPHSLSFYMQRFVEGKSQGETGDTLMSIQPGRHNVMLLVRPQEKSFRLGIAMDGNRISHAESWSSSGYGSTRSHGIHARLVEGKKLPVYVFAANRGDISSFSASEQLDEMIKSADMVVVIFAELQRTREIGQR